MSRPIRKQFVLEGKLFECCAILTHDNHVYYRLQNFAHLLGYFDIASPSRLIDNQFKTTWSQLSDRTSPSVDGWHPKNLFVSEPGIYSLLFRSRSQYAKVLCHPIIQVVLPTIREQTVVSTQGLIEELQEKLSEGQGREAKWMEMLEDRERSLTQTRIALDASFDLLNQCQAELEEEKKKRRSRDSRTVPDSPSVHYTLGVYQHGNIYKFIRAQKRCLVKARKRIPPEYKLVYSVNNVSNPFHIVNRLKELLPRCKVRYNTITSDANVVELIKECVKSI